MKWTQKSMTSSFPHYQFRFSLDLFLNTLQMSPCVHICSITFVAISWSISHLSHVTPIQCYIVYSVIKMPAVHIWYPWVTLISTYDLAIIILVVKTINMLAQCFYLDEFSFKYMRACAQLFPLQIIILLTNIKYTHTSKISHSFTYTHTLWFEIWTLLSSIYHVNFSQVWITCIPFWTLNRLCLNDPAFLFRFLVSKSQLNATCGMRIALCNLKVFFFCLIMSSSQTVFFGYVCVTVFYLWRGCGDN